MSFGEGNLRERVRELEEENEKLRELAGHAWSIAVCAMRGMPIPVEWADKVERGLREFGIDAGPLYGGDAE